ILLDNALKYNRQEGTVMIRLEAGGSEGWKLTVSDTGTGIPADELPLIFERFYRVDRSRGRESGGAGLGLSIAKSLVEQAGGEIGLDCPPAGGSIFWFTVPEAV
ncbi:sensor histidine kinase, partial [Paenibacillus sepulcri]|nr:sensor histidine kinase [Paenibacillus sepulcri]